MTRVIFQTPGGPSAALLAQIKAYGGKVKRRYKNVNEITVQIPACTATLLGARTDVDYVSMERMTVAVGSALEDTTGADQVRNVVPVGGGTMNGDGIGIAILDSGVDVNHQALLDANGNSRVVASVDFTGEGRTDDPYGHGTHVASTAAGSNAYANGLFAGIAPNAKIINLRVLNSMGEGSESDTVSAIDWAIANKDLYNIKVLNLSLGATAVDSYANDPLCLAVRRAVDAGLVVCVAAGNNGKDAQGNKIYGQIHSPGIEPSAITVGAANTFQTTNRDDDGITTYSSRGPTRGHYTDDQGVVHYDNLIKPDMVAPGNKIAGAEADHNHVVQGNGGTHVPGTSGTAAEMVMSGTSVATPVVAGSVALLLQANPNMTPNLVKGVLEYTAQPLAGFNTLEQGAGELNVEGAIRLAGLIRQDLGGLNLGDPLLTGSAPTPSTTIGGVSFVWAGGIVENWDCISGTNLMTQYQGIYGTSSILLGDGLLLGDGVLAGDGILASDGLLLGDGILVGDGPLVSNGTTLDNGTLFVDGLLLGDGTVLSDGLLLGDGFLLGDGLLLGDSILLGDNVRGH
jgi:subtilisin family serine protease